MTDIILMKILRVKQIEDNEGKTIAKVLKEAKKSKYANEILVVDGYSKDNTVSEAKKAGAKVVEQYKDQYPGKGIAIKTARDIA